MNELLNLLKVGISNYELADEELIKIKNYIEKGTSLELKENHKYDIEKYFNKYYNMVEVFWKSLDSLMEQKEIFKRILNVFADISGESFFKVLYLRFSYIDKIMDYLRYMDNKERLLIWFIKIYSNSVSSLIAVSEELINEDRLLISKAFSNTEDIFVKLVLSIIAIKNSCIIPEDGNDFIKLYLSEIKDEGRQTTLLQFLYYASSKDEKLNGLFSNILNNSKNKRTMFNQLVSFISTYDNKFNIYDFVQAFDIDKELYVFRMIDLYMKDESKKVFKDIGEKIKNMPEVFRRAADHADENNLGNVEKLVLMYFICSYSKEKTDLELFKQCIGKILRNLIDNFKVFKSASQFEKIKILEYMLKDKNKGSIDGYAARADKWLRERNLQSCYAFCFKLIYLISETKNIVYRVLNSLISLEQYEAVACIIYNILQSNSMSYISFAEKLADIGISEKHLIFTADMICLEYNWKNDVKAEAYLKELCSKGSKELIRNISKLATERRLLETLFKINKEKYSELLIKKLPISCIRDELIELLSSYEGCKEKVISCLKNKDEGVREAAARILINFDMIEFRELLEKTVSTEKSKKVKFLIFNIIDRSYLDQKSLQSAESISEYCTERLRKISYKVPKWIPVNELQKLRHENGEEVSKEVIIYLISRYSFETTIRRSSMADMIINKCNKQDLDLLGNEILNIWINNGADTKQKWVLGLVASIGGFDVVNALKTQIDLWSKSARWVIACEAVKALSINGSNEALITIDNIARKYKHKQIKSAAKEAFTFAAKLFNLSEEELADKIIPDLGFNKRGEREFDYGSRSFIAKLNLNSSLTITDNNNKVIKTLPKANKSDDELKAKEALKEFKELKKQIKTITSSQSLRLEIALSQNKIWSKKDWESLFVENSIMHNFSLALVWGVYEEGKLKNTFRYMEDGTFNTKEEEEYQLLENSFIGLVHPLEMGKDELDAWIQQFEDYEIVQPFPQLKRKICKVSKDERLRKSVERFSGVRVNGLSLVGRLTKLGWYRGVVQDEGRYYEIYKEDEKIGIGVQLSFYGLYIGDEDEETTVYDLVFYTAGTVGRWSDDYEGIDEENVIVPERIPERFFSEILYDVDRALVAKNALGGKQ